MNFIQAERVSQVNFFIAPNLGGWNLVTLLSVALVLAWLVLTFYSLKNNYSREIFIKKAWWLLLIAWLPLALSSSLSFSSFFNRGVRQVNQSLDAKQQSRLCEVDKNQKLEGVLCGVYPTIVKVKEITGPSASLCYTAFSFARPFLTFGLFDEYGLSADCQKADYLLAYLTEQKINYSTDGHVLLTRSGVVGEEIVDYGRFEAPQSLGDGIFLLKRVK